MTLAIQFQGRELTEEEQRAMEENRVKRETQLLREDGGAQGRGAARRGYQRTSRASPVGGASSAEGGRSECRSGAVWKSHNGNSQGYVSVHRGSEGRYIARDLTSYQTREIKGGKIILSMSLTDYNAAMTVKAFVPEKEFHDGIEPNLAKGRTLTVKGRVRRIPFCMRWCSWPII
ncbi:MAG: hypothetical protein ACLR23_12670 [Clostridia bacterium]